MTNKEVEINFNKLEKEVEKAVYADDKYWRENSAKLRAIEQRVPTYEDFRQMVLASNLRPLDKGETIRSGTNKKIWNSTALNSDIKAFEIKDTNQILPKKPMTSKEILKIWKKFDENNSKWEFLETSSDDLKEILKTESDSDFLGELIFFFDNYLTTSNNIFEVQKLNLIFDFLDQFSKSRRFELSIMFLTDKTKFSLNRVFQLSRQFFEKSNQSSIENLDILYKVYFK